MADTGELKEVKKVLIGPLLADNASGAGGVLGAGGHHQAGNGGGHDAGGNAGDSVFQHVYLNDPPPHTQQRKDHRADGDHRLAGDRGRSAPARLRL